MIVGEKIFEIALPGQLRRQWEDSHFIDGEGLLAFPGLIDGHVHIDGGGGEEGYASRIGEIDGTEILEAGITTVVGLLGADNQTKSLFSLLAKAKSLEAEGITTYIYSGSYSVPVVTFTGDIAKDMVLIDKVIGAGEIAVADHRSSHPDTKDLLALASSIHLAGMLAEKAGLLHLHLGDGKEGFGMVNRLLHQSDLPADTFLPTHVNRNPMLFEQAIAYTKSGGNIDLTAGEESGIPLPEAVERLVHARVDMQKVTISSDANGSIPGGGAGKIQTLFDDVIRCITEKTLNPETVFSLVTENPAKRLKQYPKKGALQAGSDADILILDEGYRLQMLFAGGELKIDKRGT